MKVAVIGSRSLMIDDLSGFIPSEATEIVSGGARGIDRSARLYAFKNGLKLKEFFPDYRRYRKGAPKRRNQEIIDYADMVVAIWDGKSKGTKSVIDKCKEIGKPIKVYEEDPADYAEKIMAEIHEGKNNNIIKRGAMSFIIMNRDKLNVDDETIEREWLKLYISEKKEARSQK